MMTASSTETGGKTLLSLPTPAEFETYIRIAREQQVFAFRLGDFAVQFGQGSGGLNPGSVIEEPDKKTAGGWKNGPELDRDPELDTRWD